MSGGHTKREADVTLSLTYGIFQYYTCFSPNGGLCNLRTQGRFANLRHRLRQLTFRADPFLIAKQLRSLRSTIITNDNYLITIY